MANPGIYYVIEKETLRNQQMLPGESAPFLRRAPTFLPPQISELHSNLKEFHSAGYSVGEMSPHRIRLTANNRLAFDSGAAPFLAALTATAQARELAGWLLLLDKWMETFVVVARARTVWSVTELAAALPFLATAYLPPALLTLAPENSARLSHALAIAIADGAMKGEPTNRHWQQSMSK